MKTNKDSIARNIIDKNISSFSLEKKRLLLAINKVTIIDNIVLSKD